MGFSPRGKVPDPYQGRLQPCARSAEKRAFRRRGFSRATLLRRLAINDNLVHQRCHPERRMPSRVKAFAVEEPPAISGLPWLEWSSCGIRWFQTAPTRHVELAFRACPERSEGPAFPIQGDGALAPEVSQIRTRAWCPVRAALWRHPGALGRRAYATQTFVIPTNGRNLLFLLAAQGSALR